MAEINTIFPSVQLNEVKTRSFTEENVANLIYNFIDHNKVGFVITDTDNYSNDDVIEFNIRGYYISASDVISDDLASGSNIYASIKIDNVTNSESDPYKELTIDQGDYSSGVLFSNTIPSAPQSGTIYSLKILEKVDIDGIDSVWKVPEESKVRFKPSNVGLNEVDGGQW